MQHTSGVDPASQKHPHWPTQGCRISPRRESLIMDFVDWVVHIWWWPNDLAEGAAGHRQSWCVIVKVLVSAELVEHAER